ncbi:hypothetical protein KDW_12150 [Dictyobacter vulcani]|uniref:Uncharacterized protein n=1 Tax=Dictyobacter vulcani TaxID=2607529 RepID=A0A5J4KH95_9CHLR|nr:hypothetical protein [Dictyobacter vulcani]GER87053.1 hypothetical protein KDW_12150 [Dictyobacter vulcani]
MVSTTFPTLVFVAATGGLVCSAGRGRNEHWLAQVDQASAEPLQSQQQLRGGFQFMHRPYYGSRTIMQRTISFMDHDKPWYADDGWFVRFDGVNWGLLSMIVWPV